MDIERSLKTIGDWISKETESRKYPKSELLELSESLQALKASIACQSVTDEEIENAIEFYERHLQSRDDDLIDDDVSARMRIVLTALRQMKPDLYPQAGNDPEADDWANGYSRGYADGLQARQMRSEPCETKPCKWCINADYIEVVAKVHRKGSWGFQAYEAKKAKHCPNCGKELVK